MAKEIQFILYNLPDNSGTVQAIVQDETIFLTQKAMAELFGVEVNTINYHLKEIYTSRELTEDSTIRKIRTVQTEGNRQVERERAFYNLDAIISVGYRVNSQRATLFRQWATRVLNEFIRKGQKPYKTSMATNSQTKSSIQKANPPMHLMKMSSVSLYILIRWNLSEVTSLSSPLARQQRKWAR